ncbi:uncharacterized protein JCM6883_005546 [Sporobolomyces salmoneus]|uniref:uncharacterized protein n=1 Tax=Sporobolomyces salmoneus TaxID=183962 RepID=UPI00317F8E3A
MSSPALGSAAPSSDSVDSTSIQLPIARSSGGEEAAKVDLVEDQLINTDSPVNAGSGGGVTELLQRALSLKEGEELDETKDGERTPGSHSRASTDLTAVEQLRISPRNSSTSPQRADEETTTTVAPLRPPVNRADSTILLTRKNADPPRSRNQLSRRPSNRPYPSQQRVSPPSGWQGPSPTSSNDGSNYNHFYAALPSQHPHNNIPNTSGPGAGGGGGGGGGYGHSTITTPPFLAHLPRHPSQISQISDQSAGYSTGSPYSSSSSSPWYQHYASAVTTPSSHPAALEGGGGLGYPNDPSPDSISEALSSQQCQPAPNPYSHYDLGHPSYPSNEFAEPSTTTTNSSAGPYQPVYFAPAPQRVVYTASPGTQSHSESYSPARPPQGVTHAPRHHSQSSQMVYPITSARPPAMVYSEVVSGPHQLQQQHNSSWRGGRHQQTLVPNQQQYASAYNPYPMPPHYAPTTTTMVDHRRYSQYQPPTQVVYQHSTLPSAASPQSAFPPIPSSLPPVIPPRPSVSSLYSPTNLNQPFPPPSSPPKIYSPPIEIARGVLASTRLREAAQPSGSIKPVRATRNEPAGRSGQGARKGNLPKPPAHSPHALWVGNVPSDASHSELWQFFVTRPSPSAVGLLSRDDIDLSSPGVESIHLIARSNCAFVNYVSNLHLQHAISVSNGLPLRPNDSRCKALLCRVRKEEDESKTGVGAQRIGGIHKAFVKLQRERMNESEEILRLKIKEEGAEPKSAATKAFEERRESSSSASVGTTSTTSSFLTKHFEKRWFIMKSHDEADLKLSVESGLWATQPHNEPVLQQAFRTAKEVFLIFSANGSGEWFGFARMKGPISSVASPKGSRPSWGSSGQASIESVSSASLSVPSQTIQEDAEEPTSFPPRPPVLFSPSEHRLAQASPSLITPTTASQSQSTSSEQRHGGSYPLKLPSEIDAEAKREMALEQERMAFLTASNLHLPPEVAEAARKAATYDSGSLKKARELNDEVPPGSLRDAILRVDAATKEASAAKASNRDDGTRLPFSRTRHIRNSFNGNREIKVSRDGTEVEPTAGQALIDEFDRFADDSPTSPPEIAILR